MARTMRKGLLARNGATFTGLMQKTAKHWNVTGTKFLFRSFV